MQLNLVAFFVILFIYNSISFFKKIKQRKKNLQTHLTNFESKIFSIF